MTGYNPAPLARNPYCPIQRAERLAWEDANFERIRGVKFRPCLPLSVGTFDANGNAKGKGW